MIIVNKERVKNLKKIIAKYPDILSDDDIEDSVVKTFTFEKTLASIELYDKKTEIVVKLYLVKNFSAIFLNCFRHFYELK